MWINRTEQNEQEQRTKGNESQVIFRRDSISRQYRVDANSVFCRAIWKCERWKIIHWRLFPKINEQKLVECVSRMEIGIEEKCDGRNSLWWWVVYEFSHNTLCRDRLNVAFVFFSFIFRICFVVSLFYSAWNHKCLSLLRHKELSKSPGVIGCQTEIRYGTWGWIAKPYDKIQWTDQRTQRVYYTFMHTYWIAAHARPSVLDAAQTKRRTKCELLETKIVRAESFYLFIIRPFFCGSANAKGNIISKQRRRNTSCKQSTERKYVLTKWLHPIAFETSIKLIKVLFFFLLLFGKMQIGIIGNT